MVKRLRGTKYTLQLSLSSRTKAKPRGELKKKLDKVFSRWIRSRDGGKCFTCKKVGTIETMQAGHYISRSVLSLRWDERNVNCQCMPCNIWKHGALDVYALNLQLKYGDGILKEFAQKKNVLIRFTASELEEMIKKYS